MTAAAHLHNIVSEVAALLILNQINLAAWLGIACLILACWSAIDSMELL